MVKREIKCTKCLYRWDTKSEMFYVSCPRCQSKVNIRNQLNIDGDDGTRRST